MVPTFDFDALPIAYLQDNDLVWCSRGFRSLSSSDQELCVNQAKIVPNSLVTEVHLAEGPFQSVAVVPTAERSRLLVFSKREGMQGLPTSSIELLALLVHDLRSPITSIYGFAETVVENDERFSIDELKIFLRKIRGAALRANVLLSNMQALASGVRASAKVRKFQLNSLVREIIDGMWLEPGAQIQAELDSCDTTVVLDYIAVERVVGNLLNNAAKFSAKDGVVSVKTRAADGGVLLTVFNTGSQILPDELPLIFEKFHRGTSSKGKPGSGLGLFIVKHLVDQLGGQISVESGESGTLFSVFFATTKLQVVY